MAWMHLTYSDSRSDFDSRLRPILFPIIIKWRVHSSIWVKYSVSTLASVYTRFFYFKAVIQETWLHGNRVVGNHGNKYLPVTSRWLRTSTTFKITFAWKATFATIWVVLINAFFLCTLLFASTIEIYARFRISLINSTDVTSLSRSNTITIKNSPYPKSKSQ